MSLKKQRILFIAGIIQFFIVFTLSLMLVVLSIEYELPILIQSVGWILMFAGTCIFVAVMFCSTTYICDECGKEIDPNFKNWLFSIKKGPEYKRKLYCENCKKKTWCKGKIYFRK